jgi:succinoglycan biosynthesis transport protein ExoP
MLGCLGNREFVLVNGFAAMERQAPLVASLERQLRDAPGFSPSRSVWGFAKHDEYTMNLKDHPQQGLTAQADILGPTTSTEALKSFSKIIRRHWRLIAATCLLGIAVSALVLAILPKKYTATASIFIDFLHPPGLIAQMAPTTLGLVDPAAVESQINILESERVALGAIKRLDLFKTPDAVLHQNPLSSGFYLVMREIGLIEPPTDYAVERSIVDAVMANTTVERAGFNSGKSQQRSEETFVIEVSYDAQDPELAARMANALAATYLIDQLEARFEMAKLANEWFTERLQGMRNSVASAEEAAQKYKADNDVTFVTGNKAMSLVDEQNLAQAEESLTSARAALADARSRLDALNQVIASGNPLAAVSEALASPAIQRLRGEYADLMQRQAALEHRGIAPGHDVSAQIRAAVAETQTLIMDEFVRIRNSTENEINSTESKIDQWEHQRTTIGDSLKKTRAKALHAAELDREATAVRTLYEAFMNQFQVTTQAQSYPVSEARMVTIAEPPVKQSRRIGLILALGGAVGLLTGGGLAWLRENAGLVKTGQELEDLIGAPSLGTLPRIDSHSVAKGQKQLARPGPLLTYAMDHPLSEYAETIRNCKASLLHFCEEPTNVTLGIVSAVQGEGKSTFAANLAFHLASSGYRTLLVDADTRNPELSSAFNKRGASGLTQILTHSMSINVTNFALERRLAFLPSGTQEAIANADELLMSPAFKKFVDSMRKEFKYVIFDLPPLAPVVEAGIVVRHLDGLYYITKWNNTRSNMIRQALRKCHISRERLIGGVINCVPKHEMEQYYLYPQS